jgi:hypothetical protein
MGFLSWFFTSKEVKAERAAMAELIRIQNERRMIDCHIQMVRESLSDTTNPLGFTLKISDKYERVVVDTLQRYATVPYTVHKIKDEDMMYEGECLLHVTYVQFPIASVISAKVATENWYTKEGKGQRSSQE